MSIVTPTNEQSVKLRHLPAYRVLLCVACGYCVLLQALDTHLKCIHHVPIARRRDYIEYARTLRLADFRDVISPGAQDQPIPGLPCFDGLICEAPGCAYISTTAKRMHAHWTSDHYAHRQRQDIERYQCRPAHVQTFFRGRNLRYFAVSAPLSNTSLRNETIPVAGLRSVIAPKPAEDILLNHFYEHTIDSVRPVQGTGPQWNRLVMQQCHSHEFLRYAVLSITACHIAHNHITQRQLYTRAADRYRHLAIKFMPQWSEEEQQNHFFTQFNFIRMIDLSYLAREGLHLLQQVEIDHTEPRNSVLSDWVTVTRSGREIWYRQRGEGREYSAMCASVMPFEQILQMQEEDLAVNRNDSRLATLTNRLLFAPFANVDPVCLRALYLLRRAWAVPHHNSSLGFRDVALLWLASVPADFLQLVRDHDPVALVILALHCVLWAQAEERYWYMKHRARSVISAIKDHLAKKWHSELDVATLEFDDCIS